MHALCCVSHVNNLRFTICHMSFSNSQLTAGGWKGSGPGNSRQYASKSLVFGKTHLFSKKGTKGISSRTLQNTWTCFFKKHKKDCETYCQLLERFGSRQQPAVSFEKLGALCFGFEKIKCFARFWMRCLWFPWFFGETNALSEKRFWS